MSSLVSVKSFDGTIVRIPIDKLSEFKIRQERILKMLNSGKSVENIKTLLKEGVL